MVGISLAPGWDSRHGTGKIGVGILARLSIQLGSGAHVDIISDESWQGARGPHVRADVYQGESYDANLSMPGWSQAGFVANGDTWVNVTATGQLPHQESRHDPNRTVVASHVNLPQVEVVGEVPPVDFWAVEGATNSWVFDFGVNRAGVTRLYVPPATAKLLGRATWTQQAGE